MRPGALGARSGTTRLIGAVACVTLKRFSQLCAPQNLSLNGSLRTVDRFELEILSMLPMQPAVRPDIEIRTVIPLLHHAHRNRLPMPPLPPPPALAPIHQHPL